jgi:hypothetical protein
VWKGNDLSEGELQKQLRNAYVKEFLGSGELWYNYFWSDEKEKKEDEEDVVGEFDGLFLPIIDKAKKDIAHAIFSGTSLELRKVLIEWFGKFGDTHNE